MLHALAQQPRSLGVSEPNRRLTSLFIHAESNFPYWECRSSLQATAAAYVRFW